MQAHARFAEAAARVPDGDVNFLLAGHHLRLRFSLTAVAVLCLVLALAHLART